MLNNRIQELRETQGYSVDALAKQLDITRGTLYNYESGKNPIPSDILIKMSLLFEVSTDYILGLTDESYSKINQFYDDIEKIKNGVSNELVLLENISQRIKNIK